MFWIDIICMIFKFVFIPFWVQYTHHIWPAWHQILDSMRVKRDLCSFWLLKESVRDLSSPQNKHQTQKPISASYLHTFPLLRLINLRFPHDWVFTTHTHLSSIIAVIQDRELQSCLCAWIGFRFTSKSINMNVKEKIKRKSDTHFESCRESSYPECFGVTLLKHFVGVLEPAGEFVGHELSLSGVPDAAERDRDDHAVIRFECVPHGSGGESRERKWIHL